MGRGGDGYARRRMALEKATAAALELGSACDGTLARHPCAWRGRRSGRRAPVMVTTPVPLELETERARVHQHSGTLFARLERSEER